ncbi:TLR4 interactor with leucine rich repeats [Pezoporus flaviventris]|uniref:TLR4 interactor with leucine rich repeats n=1 Tax=Pezoporus flaviventris TaxID=889875 RepID=UPI002AB2A6B4|nr:TLR4 interactor with leucine rich repeats [Pezoporus flaviventris]
MACTLLLSSQCVQSVCSWIQLHVISHFPMYLLHLQHDILGITFFLSPSVAAFIIHFLSRHFPLPLDSYLPPCFGARLSPAPRSARSLHRSARPLRPWESRRSSGQPLAPRPAPRGTTGPAIADRSPHGAAEPGRRQLQCSHRSVPPASPWCRAARPAATAPACPARNSARRGAEEGPISSRGGGGGDAGATQSQRGKQPTARPGMGAPRWVRLMLLPRVLWGSVPLFFLLLPAAESICPEPCDCQQHQHLLCTNRGLRSVPKAAEPQDVLTYSLGGNFIANISAFDFHRLAGLQRLDLQYNRIRSLHPKAFERLDRLEELYLGNNLLPALAPGTLSTLAKLRILYVNANEIGRLSAASFSGLSSLVKLRLDGNELGSLGDSTFSGLPNLLYLHLESNRIRWLSRGAFTGLAKLRFLDLSGNQQSSLRHPDIFGPLRSLHTLLLASNSLQQLTGGLFQHLPGLAKLSLSGNRLAHLAPDAFTGLGSLKELRLEGNLLSHLPAALLEPLSSLEALDLSRNALTSLHPATFGHLDRLRELSLRDNALTTVPGELFASNPALYRLELEGNAWSCDCRLRGLKHWLGAWHSQGRLLTVFVQCRRPPALAGKYLDYLQDAQLPPPQDGGSCHDGAAPSAASPPPSVEGLGSNSSSEGLPRGLPGPPPSASTARLLGAPEGPAPPPRAAEEAASPTPPLPARPSASGLAPPSAAWPRRAGKARSAPAAGVPPLVSDPCDFNKLFLCNLSVETVGSTSVTVRWAVRPHRSPRLLGPARFRLLFDRFGAAVKFQRFVYLPERGEPAATLRELRPDTPYLVCVEGILGGRVCPVAPRDHCAGLVTLPESGAAAAAGGSRGPDQQLLTLVLLAVNALLLFAALAAWASRLLRKKVLGRRRRKAAPVHVRHLYSTRRPLRSMGTGVSNDFSGFQSHRSPRGAACALSEADLIEFPCERFMDSSGGGGGRHGDDHLLQRFAD